MEGEMKAIRFLQFSSVGIFIAVSVSGAAIMWFIPQKLADFKAYVEMIWPFWVGEVIPALIGTPLTEAVRNLTGKRVSAPEEKDDGK